MTKRLCKAGADEKQARVIIILMNKNSIRAFLSESDLIMTIPSNKAASLTT